MNRFFIFLCLLLFANSFLYSQCYEPIRNDGITFYNKAQYPKALSCFMAAKRCQDKPASHDLDKWIADCNTKIKTTQTTKKSPQDENKIPTSEKTNEVKNTSSKTGQPCYIPIIKAAHVSMSNNNFSDAKELFNEARKCADRPIDHELALYIKICDDELEFLDCIKNNYTPFYNRGTDFLKIDNVEKAKENFLIASISDCIPSNSDIETKIEECNQKLNEKRFNTLLQDTIETTLWGKEGVFMGSVQYNQPNGNGLLLFTKDQLLKSMEADFENGKPIGIIHCKFHNQDEFIGTLADDDFDAGTYHYANGDQYKGSFIQRAPNGDGTILYANGDSYTGNVVNGKKEGVGKFVSNFGYITNTQETKTYEGNWNANQKMGFGKCYDEKGELIHEGIFTDDFPEKDYPNRLIRVSFNWVKIPEGSFTMGCTLPSDCTDKDRPAHVVALSEFQISDKEVTVAQYRAFCEATGRSMPSKPSWGWVDDNPITHVSWNDAVAFCQWNNCRLPTEAEWEYAAQGAIEPRQKLYSGGNDLREVAYFQDNTQNPRATGKKKPNALFLYDMSGNVSEWVNDWFGAYSEFLQNNPKGSSAGTHKVVRGGSWRSSEYECRITYRGMCEPNQNTDFIGFRVVRNW